MQTSKLSFSIGKKLADYVTRVVPDLADLSITWAYVPPMSVGHEPNKAQKFAAIELSSGSIGIAFAAYIPPDEANIAATREAAIVGHCPEEFIHFLGDDSALPAQRTLSMAVINALSTWHMKETGLIERLEYADAVDAMAIGPADVVGMVGMFPPLVPTISKAAAFLNVIELKPDLVQSHEKWCITLDHEQLRKCNKIIVTGTVLLNGTLHSLIDLVAHADVVALIGPTASFLPEPLFDLGFDIVGGSMVVDPAVFKARLSAGRTWEGVEKFVARKERWA